MMNFEKLKSDAENFKDTSVEKMEIWKDIIIRPQIIRVKHIISNTDCTVSATFDIKIDENTIKDNVSLKNPRGDTIDGYVSWHAQTKTIIFRTAISNVPADMYMFTLSKNIKDLKGSHMNEDYPYSFPIQGIDHVSSSCL